MPIGYGLAKVRRPRIAIIQPDGDQLVIRKYGCVKELENSVLGGLWSGNEPRKTGKRTPHFFIVSAVQPPFLTHILIAVSITFGLYTINKPLI